MRLDPDVMMRASHGAQDEFDVYFARAALEEMEHGPGGDNRRGSLPSAPAHLAVKALAEEGAPRRTASCKFPSRHRRKGGSVSPRPPSNRASPAKAAAAAAGGGPDATMTSSSSSSMLPSSQLGNGMVTSQAPGAAGTGAGTVTTAAAAQPTGSAGAAAAAPGGPSEATLAVPNSLLDFKCHSAPHSRSSSWKKMRRPRSSRDMADAEGSRGRAGSIPFEESISARLEQLKLLQAEDCCVVRNFALSSKGLVNRGDSFKRKSFSVASDAGSAGSGGDQGNLGDLAAITGSTLSIHSQDSPNGSTGAGPGAIAKVLILGQHGVGKTALIQQFMTSDYMGALETSFDDDVEKTVSVLLDGEETMVDFYDLPSSMDYRQIEGVDAYVLVYSITDPISFQHVLDTLDEIRRDDSKHPPIIVVANKGDLVRSRQVQEEEGKGVCLHYDCKYIETSAALNHRVDELLVGTVTQIRLHPKRLEKRKQLKSAESADKDITCVNSAKGLLHKLFRKRHGIVVSKSCDNLLVL